MGLCCSHEPHKAAVTLSERSPAARPSRQPPTAAAERKADVRGTRTGRREVRSGEDDVHTEPVTHEVPKAWRTALGAPDPIVVTLTSPSTPETHVSALHAALAAACRAPDTYVEADVVRAGHADRVLACGEWACGDGARRRVLLGGPGAGKTAALQALFRRLAKAAGPLPVYVPLEALGERVAEPGAIDELISSLVGVPAASLAALAESVVLLIDSFDAVADAPTGRCWLDRNPFTARCPVVLAVDPARCRRVAAVCGHGADVAHLCPFTVAQAAACAAGCGSALLSAAVRDRRHAALLSRPLPLRLLAGLPDDVTQRLLDAPTLTESRVVEVAVGSGTPAVRAAEDLAAQLLAGRAWRRPRRDVSEAVPLDSLPFVDSSDWDSPEADVYFRHRAAAVCLCAGRLWRDAAVVTGVLAGTEVTKAAPRVREYFAARAAADPEDFAARVRPAYEAVVATAPPQPAAQALALLAACGPLRGGQLALAGRTFTGGDLRGMVLLGVDLTGTVFDACWLHGAEFHHCTGRADDHPAQGSDTTLAVAVSPTTGRVFTGTADGALRADGAGVAFTGHADAVTGVALSADGAFVATASADGSVRVWDAVSGAEQGVFGIASGGRRTGVAVAADGSYVVAGGDDGAMVWRCSAPNDAPVRLCCHDAAVEAVALAPDGRLLASGSADGSIILWDAVSWMPVDRIKTGASVDAVAFSPDCRAVASGGHDGKVRVHCLATAATQELCGHAGGLTGVAFSPDGRWLATYDDRFTALLWDVAAAAVVGSLVLELLPTPSAHTARGIAFSPCGRAVHVALGGGVHCWDVGAAPPVSEAPCGRSGAGVVHAAFLRDGGVVTAGDDGRVIIWRSGRASVEYTPHPGPVRHCAVVRDGASSSGEELIVTYSAEDDAVRATSATSAARTAYAVASAPVTAMAAVGDGTLLTLGTAEGGVEVFDAATGDHIHSLQGHAAGVVGAAIESDTEATVATFSRDQTIRVWDAAAGDILQDIDGLVDYMNDMSASADGRVVATCCGDDTVQVWDGETGRAERLLRGHTDSVMSVAVAPDGGRVCSSGYDGVARMWDTATGEELFVALGHADAVVAVQFSQDATVLLTASLDGTLRIWNAATGIELHRFDTEDGDGEEDWAHGLALFPNNVHAVAGGADGGIRLLDVARNERSGTFVGHTAAVRCLAVFPDGATFISGGNDNAVRIWNTATRTLKFTLKGHRDRVRCVGLGPDGSVLSCSNDKTVRLWDLGTRKAAATLLGHKGPVLGAAATAAGYLSFGLDGTVRAWDAATHAERLRFEQKGGQVHAVAMMEGGRVVSGGDDGHVRVWDAASGEEMHAIAAHAERVTCIAAAPDGVHVVSGSADGTIRVTHTGTGALVCALILRHTAAAAAVTCTAFAPNGSFIACGDAAGDLHVWAWPSGASVASLAGHTGLLGIAVSGDSGRVVSWGRDGVARVWKVRDEAARLCVSLEARLGSCAMSPLRVLNNAPAVLA